MLRSVVVVPHPPLLVPGLGGATDPLAALRARCLHLVRSGGGPVVLVGDGPETTWYDGGSGSFGPWGAHALSARFGRGSAVSVTRIDAHIVEGAPALPLSLLVGAWLCAEVGVEVEGAWSVADDAGPTSARGDHEVPWDEPAGPALEPRDRRADEITVPDGAALVVCADGTAARGDKPPAGVHPEAEKVDRDLERLLADADTAGLQRFAPAPALQCQGAPALRALGHLAAAQAWATSDVTHESPFGVAYLTARWVPKT